MAIKFYGSARFETALVGANALDAHGGSAIVAGQPLEIPAPSHHRVEQNETWAELARIYLGDAKRAETLARDQRRRVVGTARARPGDRGAGGRRAHRGRERDDAAARAALPR